MGTHTCVYTCLYLLIQYFLLLEQLILKTPDEELNGSKGPTFSQVFKSGQPDQNSSKRRPDIVQVRKDLNQNYQKSWIPGPEPPITKVLQSSSHHTQNLTSCTSLNGSKPTVNSDKQHISARDVKQNQLDRLESKGLRLYSSFGVTYHFTDNENNKKYRNFNQDTEELVTVLETQDYFKELNSRFSGTGKTQVELKPNVNSSRNMKLSLLPQWGMNTASDVFILSKVGQDLQREGKVLHNVACNIYFTLSLWNKAGENVFCGEDGQLSDTGRQFLAGLCSHGAAISALCCLTANKHVYRKTSTAWREKQLNSKRVGYFKTKTNKKSGQFLKICLPGEYCDPYLLLASILAAGIDGMERNMDLLPWLNAKSHGYCGFGSLPCSPSEAYSSLNSDYILLGVLTSELLRKIIVTPSVSLARNANLTKIQEKEVVEAPQKKTSSFK